MTLFVFRLNTALYSSELLKLHTGWSVMLCLFLSSSFRPSPFLCKPWYLFPFFSFFFFSLCFFPPCMDPCYSVFCAPDSPFRAMPDNLLLSIFNTFSFFFLLWITLKTPPVQWSKRHLLSLSLISLSGTSFTPTCILFVLRLSVLNSLEHDLILFFWQPCIMFTV